MRDRERKAREDNIGELSCIECLIGVDLKAERHYINSLITQYHLKLNYGGDK